MIIWYTVVDLVSNKLCLIFSVSFYLFTNHFVNINCVGLHCIQAGVLTVS